MRRASLLALVVFASLLPTARADDPRVPSVQGLVLDGKTDEAAWQGALVLPAAKVKVLAALGAEGRTVEVAPDVRVAASEGLLWIAVSFAEDPGLATGIALQIAADDAKGATEAVALAYVPLDLRAPRYVARGPRGATRAEYRFRAAADLSKEGASRLEAAIPVSDVADAGAPLRIAIQVQTRTPGTVVWVPEGSGFAPPARWLRLLPPAEGWGTEGAIDVEAMRADDDRDAFRLEAWTRYLEASQVPLEPAPRDQVLAEVRKALVAPLDDMLSARPDLASAHWVKADVLRKVGLGDEARAEARTALDLVPGFREAAFALHVEALAADLSERSPAEESDYVSALDRVDGVARAVQHPFEKDGVEWARAVLLYERGDFAQAIARLEPLAERYPSHAAIVETLARARKSQESWPLEERWRAQDAAKGNLPRARIVTSRGTVVVELFEDDAPNTVKNFVWLAQKRFYDGGRFHRVVPFFVAQGGDPLASDPERQDLLGAGGPCYTIRTEPGNAPGQRHRRPWRGSIAMARAGLKDTEGSQFFLTTGTAAHLDGDFTVFGRIVEGQAVADRIVQGDPITGVEVENLREGVEYRPVTTQGLPAPEPRPCGPGDR